MSSSNCCFLTCIPISQEVGQVVWYSHLLKSFPQFVVIHTVKGFSIVSEAEADIFLKFSCFFYDPTNVGNSHLFMSICINLHQSIMSRSISYPYLYLYQHVWINQSSTPLSTYLHSCTCYICLTPAATLTPISTLISTSIPIPTSTQGNSITNFTVIKVMAKEKDTDFPLTTGSLRVLFLLLSIDFKRIL